MTESLPASPAQPRGIWVLFITEMWERFSYYGMRALLVLYLIASTEGERAGGNPGFGWSEESAYLLYGIYTWAVYLTPILGGILADRLLGTHRSLLIGGWIIAAGHICLAATELFGISAGQAVTLQSGPGALVCFLTGLSLVVIGTGFFKPCASVMVGQLYEENDPRRDGGFTIFYMGINVGAFAAPLVAGTLGETVGWHWGFGAAAVGMILGLCCYQALRPRYLDGIGLAPDRPETSHGRSGPASVSLSSVEVQRIAVILILAFVGNIAFWAAFEQAGSSMNVFAAQSTDRTIWGFLSEPFPATWYQAANPAAVILFAPLFAWLWVALGRRNREPSTPVKFAMGLWLLGLAFIAMVFGAMQARDHGLAGPQWLLITYVVYTWGELCLSPVGLSMVTKLSPAHLQSLMMGVWFFTFSLANLAGGLIARFSVRLASGEWTFLIDGLPGFYLLLVLVPCAVGTLILAMTPWLKRLMHGVH
ncbi:MAG: peptide MFS transporter [Pseudomonadales bacterium]|jgi:POT family proton-dependent oligopeptide transporter